MYSRPRSGSTGSNGSSFSSASVLVPPPLHVQHLSSNASQTRIVETTDRDQYVPSHYNRMRRRHHAHYAKLIPSSSHTYGTTGIDPREHEMSIDFNARAKQPPQPNLNVQNSHNPHPNNLMQLQTEVKGFPNNGAEQDNRGQDMEVHQPHDQTMPQSSYGQRRQLPLQKENEHQTGKIGTSSCYQATIVHHGNKDDDQTTPVQETARQINEYWQHHFRKMKAHYKGVIAGLRSKHQFPIVEDSSKFHEQLSHLEAMNECLEKNLGVEKRKANEQQVKNNELQRHLNEFKALLTSQRQKNEQLQQDNTKHQEEIGSLQQQLSELNEKLTCGEETVDRPIQKIVSNKAISYSNYEEHKREIEALQHQLNATQAALKAWQKHAAETEITWRNHANALQQQINVVKEENKQALSASICEKEQIEGELVDSRKRIQSLEKQLQREQKLQSAKAKSYETAITTLETEISALRSAQLQKKSDHQDTVGNQKEIRLSSLETDSYLQPVCERFLVLLGRIESLHPLSQLRQDEQQDHRVLLSNGQTYLEQLLKIADIYEQQIGCLVTGNEKQLDCKRNDPKTTEVAPVSGSATQNCAKSINSVDTYSNSATLSNLAEINSSHRSDHPISDDPKQIAILETMLAEESRKHDTTIATLRETELELEAVRHRLTEQWGKETQLQTELEYLQNRLAGLENELASRVDSHRHALALLAEQHEGIEGELQSQATTTQQELIAVSGRLSEVQQAHESLQLSYTEAKDTIGQFNSKIDSIATENKHLREQLAKSQDMISKLETDCAEKQCSLEEARTALLQMEERYNQDIKELESAVEIASAKSEQQQQRVNELEDLVATSAQEKDQLRLKIDSLEAQLTSANENLQQQSQFMQQLQSLESNRIAQQHEISTQTESHETFLQSHEAQQELFELRALTYTLKEEKRQLVCEKNSLDLQCSQLNAQIAGLQHDAEASAERTRSSITSEKDAREKLNRLSEVEQQLQTMQTQHLAIEKELVSKEEEALAWERECQELQSIITVREETIEQLRQSMPGQELRGRYMELESELRREKQRTTHLRDEIDGLKTTLHQMRALSTTLATAQKEQRRQVDIDEGTYSETITAEREKHAEKVMQLEKQISDLSMKYEASEYTCAHLRQRLTASVTQNADSDVLMKKVEDVQEQKERLEQRLAQETSMIKQQFQDELDRMHEVHSSELSRLHSENERLQVELQIYEDEATKQYETRMLTVAAGDLDSATISSTLTELGAADVGMQFIRLNEGTYLIKAPEWLGKKSEVQINIQVRGETVLVRTGGGFIKLKEYIRRHYKTLFDTNIQKQFLSRDGTRQ